MNIYEHIPENLPSEITDVLLSSGNIRIERIISAGQTSPEEGWYDQQQNEWVVLLEGLANIAFEDGTEVSLKRGDYLLIPAHTKHKVTFTSSDPKCVWLAIFY